MPAASSTDQRSLSSLDRVLRLFGDVKAGEGLNCVLLFSNIFLLLVAYYVLKTVREPLVLATGGAEIKTYAAAAQAALHWGTTSRIRVATLSLTAGWC